jgi:hypothetical protein
MHCWPNIVVLVKNAFFSVKMTVIEVTTLKVGLQKQNCQQQIEFYLKCFLVLCSKRIE